MNKHGKKARAPIDIVAKAETSNTLQIQPMQRTAFWSYILVYKSWSANNALTTKEHGEHIITMIVCLIFVIAGNGFCIPNEQA
jgi:hypothetical protein